MVPSSLIYSASVYVCLFVMLCRILNRNSWRPFWCIARFLCGLPERDILKIIFKKICVAIYLPMSTDACSFFYNDVIRLLSVPLSITYNVFA